MNKADHQISALHQHGLTVRKKR